MTRRVPISPAFVLVTMVAWLAGVSPAVVHAQFRAHWNLLLPHDPRVPSGSRTMLNGEWSAVYDAPRHRMLLISGAPEMWSLSLDGAPTWTRLDVPLTGGPEGVPVEAVYDSRRDRLIVIAQGWFLENPLGPVWALSLTEPMTWNLLSAVNDPSGRSHFRLHYDEDADAVVLYGGTGEIGAPAGPVLLKPHPVSLNDYWLLHLDDPSWQRLGTTGGYPGQAISAVFDPMWHRMIGIASPTVWEMPLSTAAWSQTFRSSGEVPSGGAVVHDASRAQLLALGADLRNLWGFPLTGYSPLFAIDPDGPMPSPRYDFDAIYDPVGDRVIVWGGAELGADNSSDEVWSITLQSLADAPNGAPRGASLALRRFQPNPARGSTMVELAIRHAGTATLEVFDLQGRVRSRNALSGLAPGTQRVRIDTGDLAPGMYLVRVTQSGQSTAGRLVVAR